MGTNRWPTETLPYRNWISESLDVLFGAPQGSVLGPEMFSIYVRNQPKVFEKCHFNSSAFADDSKITLPVNNIEHATLLQKSMESIYKWESDNNMRFNISKFNVIKFGRNNDMK